VIRHLIVFCVTHAHDDPAQPQFAYSRGLTQPLRLPHEPPQQKWPPHPLQQSMYVIPFEEQRHQPQRWLPPGQLFEPVIVQQKQLVPLLQHLELGEQLLQCDVTTLHADSGCVRYRTGATARADAPITNRTSKLRRDVPVSSADTAALISLCSPGIVHPLSLDVSPPARPGATISPGRKATARYARYPAARQPARNGGAA
jgi:hypothetical protein